MLANILGENDAMLGDIGQEMGESMNEIMSSNDQILRDIFGEDLDTMFARATRGRRSVIARPKRRELPAYQRVIGDGAVEAELVDEPRRRLKETTPDAIEAEIVAETVDSGTAVIQETGAGVRAATHLRRPLPDFSRLAAEAMSEMRTRHATNIASRSTALDQAVADRRAKLDQAVTDRRAKRR
ncbi:MAG: hypothetical protein QOE68_3815 [Thermoanaerobaculia bacterium]|nr:hypothetical protein [Thermoanaerobaculia bacterium]